MNRLLVELWVSLIVGVFLAAILLQLTGPDQQPIELNPQQIVTLRPPRASEHFAPGVKCLIHTTDGRVVTVVEDCSAVRSLQGVDHGTSRRGF